MGRNYKGEDFILMKDFVRSRTVQNCGEWVCERVIFSSPRGLAGRGEVPDLAGRGELNHKPSLPSCSQFRSSDPLPVG